MKDLKSMARGFKALSDETRLRILELLKAGEMCACRLQEELGITQSGLSYHMRILSEASLVVPREEGKWTHYSLSLEGISSLERLLSSLKEDGASVSSCACHSKEEE